MEMPENRFDRIRKEYERKREEPKKRKENIKHSRKAYQMYLSKDAEEKLDRTYDEIRIAAIKSRRDVKKNDFYSAVVAIGTQDLDAIKRYLEVA
jgi:hypothetical protein